MNAHIIFDDLAVGSYTAMDEMVRLGWTPVCTANNAPPNGAAHFPLTEHCENQPQIIADGIRYVVDGWKDGKKMFVFCQHGMNRSVLIAAGALTVAKRNNYLVDGIKQISLKRPIATAMDTTLQEVVDVVLKLKRGQI